MIALLAVALTGCQSAATLSGLSRKHDLAQETVDTGLFRHAVAYNRVPASPGDRLYVYIEGDGSPWIAGRRIAADPTPRQPLALLLMVQDRNPALYLGRPCYFGLANSAGCQFHLWTDARYSAAVIESMAMALETLRTRLGATEVVLIGYSGGGAIAALLAARNPHVSAVVTIAGNLDIELWAETHGYLPLTGSLNPRDQPPLNRDLASIHLSAGNDTVVPPAVLDSYLKHQDGERWLYPDFDHRCCWAESWPDILARINRRLGR